MPLIAMTREMGSLGRDVAAGIAARMSRNVVYQEIIEPIADKMRLRKSHVERFLDGKAGLWERLTTDKTSLSIFTADETYRLLRDGSTGVIRGWGAVHLLKDVSHVVRVRICAPFETRVTRMMQRLGTEDRGAVVREIGMSEEAHGAITRRHFGVNWHDAEHYDLVLSTERLTVDECIDEVECIMRKKRFQETPESMRLMDNMAVEWAVRSALRRDPRTSGMTIAVAAASGRVTLSGVVDAYREARAAAEVAATAEGVREVDDQLVPADPLALRSRRRA
jgi:cytidylate kinase